MNSACNWGVCSFYAAGINVGHVSASSLFITFQHRQSHFYDFPVSVSPFLGFPFIFSFLWLFEKCFQCIVAEPFFASVDKSTKAKVERKVLPVATPSRLVGRCRENHFTGNLFDHFIGIPLSHVAVPVPRLTHHPVAASEV